MLGLAKPEVLCILWRRNAAVFVARGDIMKTYELHLPVFKQGDDLSLALEKTDSIQDAFVLQAEFYEKAASMCRRMASVAAEGGLTGVHAGTHHISVEGDPERLESLAKEKLLVVFNGEAGYED
jgi:hypothetical protein